MAGKGEGCEQVVTFAARHAATVGAFVHQLDARPPRQDLYRVGKGEILLPHDQRHYVAVHLAAKAIIVLIIRIDVTTRAALLMKRTAAGEVVPRLAQRRVFAHQGDDVDRLFDFPYLIVTDEPGHAPGCSLGPARATLEPGVRFLRSAFRVRRSAFGVDPRSLYDAGLVGLATCPRQINAERRTPNAERKKTNAASRHPQG